MTKRRTAALTMLLLGAGARLAPGYAVLTHEAIIDSAWNDIKQVLVQRFPGPSDEDLKQAHAYAYGGCIIQDMGYYPLASHFFSDLVHYVRSADFVEALLGDAQTMDELAFALGALAHYAADNSGHPLAVNRAVPLEYPKLRARYGNVITYEDNPVAHLKTEFGFDVVEVAQGNYADEDYHDFIGFKVSKELLARAFRDTYGMELKDQFHSLDLALGTYRRTVSIILPEATKIAWASKKNEIVKARPTMTKRKYLYNLRRASYEKEWGQEYERPGIFARFMAFVIRIIPKIGPLKTLAFKAPTQQTEQMFMLSFNKTLDSYRSYLREVTAGQLHLSNTDLDTGRLTHPGEYKRTDTTYGKLLRELAKHNFQQMPPDLRANLLAFYRDPRPPANTLLKPDKPDAREWQETLAALEKLKALDTNQATRPAVGQ